MHTINVINFYYFTGVLMYFIAYYTCNVYIVPGLKLKPFTFIVTNDNKTRCNLCWSSSLKYVRTYSYYSYFRAILPSWKVKFKHLQYMEGKFSIL